MWQHARHISTKLKELFVLLYYCCDCRVLKWSELRLLTFFPVFLFNCVLVLFGVLVVENTVLEQTVVDSCFLFIIGIPFLTVGKYSYVVKFYLFIFNLNLPTEFISIIRLVGFIFLNQWFSTCCSWIASIHALLRDL